MVIRCELLEKKKDQVDGECSGVNTVCVNEGEKLNSDPGDEESGGQLLEEVGRDQVTRIVLHTLTRQNKATTHKATKRKESRRSTRNHEQTEVKRAIKLYVRRR